MNKVTPDPPYADNASARESPQTEKPSEAIDRGIDDDQLSFGDLRAIPRTPSTFFIVNPELDAQELLGLASEAAASACVIFMDKYANGVVVDLPYPTDDVRLLTKAAVDALDRVFRPGFAYSKAEVMLLSLCQPGEYTDDLFAASQPTEATRVMAVLDQINGRWGRGTLRSASVPSCPDWAMRREMMSRSYTTRLDQLWVVDCR